MRYPLWLSKLLIRTRLTRWLPALRRQALGAEGYLHYFSDRVLAAPHQELQLFADCHDVHAPDAINLAQATPQFEIVPSLHSRQSPDRRGTPPPRGLRELRSALTAYVHTQRAQAPLPADEVLVTHGAAGAFATVADTLINPGNRVVLFDPCSPLFSFMLRQRRARISYIPTWQDEGRVRFHFDMFAQVLRGAKMLALADPNNPTGGTIAPEDREQLAWWANRYDVFVCEDMTFDAFQYAHAGPLFSTIPNTAARTVTIGSLSASHALAAARIGWLFGPQPVVDACALTQHLTGPFVPIVSQQQACAALRIPGNTIAGMRAEFAATRQYVIERLRSFGLQPLWPAGGYFVWLPIHEFNLSGRAFANELLQTKKVLVTPGELFGPSGARFVRLSFAGDAGRLREGLTRLGEFLAAVRPQASRVSEPRGLPVARLITADDAPQAVASA